VGNQDILSENRARTRTHSGSDARLLRLAGDFDGGGGGAGGCGDGKQWLYGGDIARDDVKQNIYSPLMHLPAFAITIKTSAPHSHTLFRHARLGALQQCNSSVTSA
jgi:hypothetical protein